MPVLNRAALLQDTTRANRPPRHDKPGTLLQAAASANVTYSVSSHYLHKKLPYECCMQ